MKTDLKELIKNCDVDELRCVSKQFIQNAGVDFVFSDAVDLIGDRLSDLYYINSCLTIEQKEKLKRLLNAEHNFD